MPASRTTADNIAAVDSISSAQTIIDIEHARIHAGIHFNITDIDTDTDISGPKYWRVTAPDTAVRMHFVFEIAATLPVLMELYENPTVNAAGTGLTAYNNDRNSATAATLVVAKDATSSGDGTLIFNTYIGSETIGSGGNAAGQSGGIERVREFILKQNEDYFIKVTAFIDNTNMTLNVSWYEVP